jgi:hypothetical protein
MSVQVKARHEVGGVDCNYSTDGMSAQDALFLLSIERMNVTNDSLSTAMDSMQAKIDEQKTVNKILQVLSGVKADPNATVNVEDELLKAGIPGGTEPGCSKWYMQALKDAGFIPPNGFNFSANDPNFHVDGNWDAFKDSLSKFCTSLSSGNELTMLNVQRLSNAAQEAAQSASAALKAQHETAMSIIRNLA